MAMEWDPKKSGLDTSNLGIVEDPEETELDVSGEETEREFSYDIDDENLVPAFRVHPDGKEALKKIGLQVVGDYDEASDGQAQRIERIRQDWRLFTNMIPRKTDYPYPGAPNPHVPLMMVQTLRLHSRFMSELVPDWTNIFGVVPLDPQHKAIADIVRRHDNWQLRTQIRDFRRQLDVMVLRFIVVGDIVMHCYWDNSNRHESLREDSFVVPFEFTSTMPDYSDCPFIVQIIMMHTHELEAKVGEWEEVETILSGAPASWDDEPEQQLHEEAKSGQGIEPAETGSTPRKILWYEGWLLLPGQLKQRYMRVVVDYATSRVMAMSLLEEPVPADRMRYRSQLAELESYREAVDAHVTMTEEISAAAAERGEDPEPYVAELGESPAAPEWMVDPEDRDELPPPMETRPVHMYVHGVCVEPYAGSLGYSIGSVAAHFNMIANVGLAMFVDQAVRANVKSFLAGDGFRVPEKLQLRPGAINKIPGLGMMDPSKVIMPLDTGPANHQLMEIVDRSQEWAEDATSASEVLSGAPGKSGEAYRGLAARIEQATKMLAVPGGKLKAVLEEIVRNNAKLNRDHLPDYSSVAISEPGQIPEMLTVKREFYENEYLFEVTADMRFTSRAQRIAEADECVQLAGAVFQQFPSPQTFEMYKKAMVNAFLERGKKDMAAAVAALPLPPPKAPAGAPAPPGAGGPPDGVSRTPSPQPGSAGPQQPQQAAPR